MIIFRNRASLILASASPRRRELLGNLGLDFLVVPAVVEEVPLPGETAGHFAWRMAGAKTLAVAAAHPEVWTLGADTVVTLQGRILGKPRDRNHALAILGSLSGATHQVITGVSLCCPGQGFSRTVIDTTDVTFIAAGPDLLRAYIATGEPLDKAGAYGIQGIGSFLVERIRGSYTNVVGLPLNICLPLLLEQGIITVHRPT